MGYLRRFMNWVWGPPILFVIVLFLIAVAGNAAPVTVSWTLPTLNDDGTVIPATGYASLASVTIEYAACIDGELSDPRLSVDLEPDRTSWNGNIMTVGDWCFTSHVTNEVGISSVDSNIAIKTIIAGILAVSETTAYVLVKQVNKLLLVTIGTIPLGTQCDDTQRILGHNVIDRDLVQYTIENHPDEYVVVALCSIQ